MVVTLVIVVLVLINTLYVAGRNYSGSIWRVGLRF